MYIIQFYASYKMKIGYTKKEKKTKTRAKSREHSRGSSLLIMVFCVDARLFVGLETYSKVTGWHVSGLNKSDTPIVRIPIVRIKK